MNRSRTPRAFLVIWTLAVVATVSAFVLHLALRGRTVALGYELGRAKAEQSRLREVKRVLVVEAASYKTPERVEVVARTLLGMEPPGPERVITLGGVENAASSVAAATQAPAPAAGGLAQAPTQKGAR